MHSIFWQMTQTPSFFLVFFRWPPPTTPMTLVMTGTAMTTGPAKYINRARNVLAINGFESAPVYLLNALLAANAAKRKDKFI